MENRFPNPGTPILRLMLVAALCFICFGAGRMYGKEKQIGACIEQPRKLQKLPVTKAEKAAFIRYYRRDL